MNFIRGNLCLLCAKPTLNNIAKYFNIITHKLIINETGFQQYLDSFSENMGCLEKIS